MTDEEGRVILMGFCHECDPDIGDHEDWGTSRLQRGRLHIPGCGRFFCGKCWKKHKKQLAERKAARKRLAERSKKK